MGSLYLLTFAGGKRYVGVTERGIDHRISRHGTAARRGAGTAVARAWRKHGKPDVRVLAHADGKYLYELEQKAIVTYATLGLRGYNMTPGGEVSPALSPIVAAKIAASIKGTKFPEWRRAALRGRKFSPETLQKMSDAKRGWTLSPEHIAKISASHRLRPMTDARRKQLDSIRPEWTQEKKDALAAKNRARIWTPEMREKMSVSKRVAAL